MASTRYKDVVSVKLTHIQISWLEPLRRRNKVSALLRELLDRHITALHEKQPDAVKLQQSIESEA